LPLRWATHGEGLFKHSSIGKTAESVISTTCIVVRLAVRPTGGKEVACLVVAATAAVVVLILIVSSVGGDFWRGKGWQINLAS